MKMLTRAELAELRTALAGGDPSVLAGGDTVARLLVQAEYALDCAALLDEAVHYPAEPYSEAEALVARLTDGVNEVWNRYRYRPPEA